MAVTTTVVSAAPPAAATLGATPIATVRSVQWGAVILGALVASSVSLVLLTFGAGIGLSAASAHPYAGASAKALAVITALYTAVTLVAAFAGGGYVAGRMRLPAAEELAEHEFRDGAHGFAVWALTLFVAGLLAATGTAGAIKTVVQATASAAAGNVHELPVAPTDYAVDRILAPAPGASPQAAQARAGLVAPVNRIFAASLKSGQLEQRDRDALTAIVMQQTGLSQADADKRVSDAYAELKVAEAKAREAAETARKAGLITAFGVAATLLIGAAAACAGAAAGARHRAERVAITWFGSRRFW
jgi:hypothetical protein